MQKNKEHHTFPMICFDFLMNSYDFWVTFENTSSPRILIGPRFWDPVGLAALRDHRDRVQGWESVC